MKIGIIGLGKLGLPVALAIESKGHQVIGYDIDPKIKAILSSRVLPYHEDGAQQLLDKTNLKLAGSYGDMDGCDIIFIAVQTPHDKEYEGVNPLPATRKDFDYSYLKTAVRELESHAHGSLIVIISTVLPGTIEREILPLTSEFTEVLYNPFFIAMGTTIRDFLNPEFVLIGFNKAMWNYGNDALILVSEFYESIHDKQIYTCSIVEAETIKVSYNTFITAKICIANTIMELCHKVGADSDAVMDALKLASDRVISPKYLSGGMGDGGGCHPRDNIALSWLAREKKLSYDLYEKLMNCRDRQTEWLADVIEQKHEETGLPVVILGKAFKKNVNITTGSPAILLTHFLKVSYTQFDPHVDVTEVPKFEPSIFFIATNHDVFQGYSFPEGSVVIDPWRFMPEQRKTTLIKIG